MVGRDIHELYPQLPEPGAETVLEVRGFSARSEYHNISFELHRGEILGLAGLVGAGRTAVARGIFGLDPPDAGTVILARASQPVSNRRATPSPPVSAISPKIAKRVGILPDMPVTQNISIAALDSMSKGPVLNLSEEAHRCGELIRKLNIKARSASMPIGRLSGGNQQKALLGTLAFCRIEHPAPR